jgi:hypothetical protein
MASKHNGTRQLENANMSRYTVDRFEGSERVVLEDDQARTFTLPRSWLPAHTKEGTVLTATTASGTTVQAVRFEVDTEATRLRVESAEREGGGLPRVAKGDVSR